MTPDSKMREIEYAAGFDCAIAAALRAIEERMSKCRIKAGPYAVAANALRDAHVAIAEMECLP